MMLLIARPGLLRSALEEVLKAGGAAPLLAEPTDELFSQALGKRTVLYVPSASQLNGFLEPRPDPQRMRRVLGATKAPGVEQVIVVVPRGGGYAPEIEVLRRDGKPFVVVECPPLFEELALLSRQASKRTRALLREAGVRMASVEVAVERVRRAIESRPHGSVMTVPGSDWGARERLHDAARAVSDAASRVRARARAGLEALPSTTAPLTVLAALLLLPFALAWGLFLLVVALPALAVFAIAAAVAERWQAGSVRPREPQPRTLAPRSAAVSGASEQRQAA